MMRRLLTIPEAARELGLSRVVVWRLARRGILPSLEVGRYRLIDPDDLASFRAIPRLPGWPKGKPRKTA